MEFEWDEQKRLSNLRKHDLDFRDVLDIFRSAHAVVPSRHAPGEERFLATARVRDRFVTVVYTVRGPRRRIISMRSARREERERYQALHGGTA